MKSSSQDKREIDWGKSLKTSQKNLNLKNRKHSHETIEARRNVSKVKI